MDNLTHTVIGATLARAGLGRKTALAMPTLLIASNLPDVDNFTGRFFSLQYFDYHRGWPHSIIGVTVLSAGLAAAIWCIGRRRDSAESGRPGFAALWCLALIGGFGHILMDLTNDYGLRPFLPFSGKWYYGDLISIVDPWLWLMFSCSLFASLRSRKIKVLWTGIAALVDAALFLMEGLAVGVSWGIAAVVGAYAASVMHGRGLRPARASLAVFAVYVCGISALHYRIIDRAWENGPAIAGAQVIRLAALPHRAGNSGGWPVILESQNFYFVGEAAGFPPALVAESFQRYPKNLDDHDYRNSLKEPRMSALARFARFPSVQVRSDANSRTVFLRDLRYARRDSPGFGAASVTIPR